jgi:hypothetical protein
MDLAGDPVLGLTLRQTGFYEETHRAATMQSLPIFFQVLSKLVMSSIVFITLQGEGVEGWRDL